MKFAINSFHRENKSQLSAFSPLIEEDQFVQLGLRKTLGKFLFCATHIYIVLVSGRKGWRVFYAGYGRPRLG